MPDRPARRRVRQPLPDREGGRRRLHRRGRGARRSSSPRRPPSRSRTLACTSPRPAGSRQLESLNEVGNALAVRGRARAAARARRAAAARAASRRGSSSIALPDGRGALRVAAADGEGADGCRIGARRSSRSKIGRVLERGAASASTRCSTIPRSTRRSRGRSACTSALYVPLLVRGPADRRRRRLTTSSGADPRFAEDDVRLAESFAARAAIAVDLSERVAATPSAASSRRRSSSGAGWRASCTTRPARR